MANIEIMLNLTARETTTKKGVDFLMPSSRSLLKPILRLLEFANQ